ncbi:hypothetical protein BX661DRAFT_32332 [Kickxella alabastrina]|uniref:uncharacterized protein n=1 Tax=Kickxella alabastrina TaxID=61397 RepID=UPI0022205EA9|nr:uncharacterized protein BX661DRAFT_32332 [Kickxella alabastrina]KAI7826296.1 hypothetical protein BX661DRAFT_32332 [Kickxella alabastrina]
MTAAAKSQIGKIPSSKIVGAGQKSSTVAMREAARKAEAARINASAATKHQVAPAANEQPLFKSVARPGPNMSRPSSQSSLRSQTSDRRSRPTPLPIVSSSNGGTSGSAATAITMSSKGKAPVRSNAGSRSSGGSIWLRVSRRIRWIRADGVFRQSYRCCRRPAGSLRPTWFNPLPQLPLLLPLLILRHQRLTQWPRRRHLLLVPMTSTVPRHRISLGRSMAVGTGHS